MRLLITRFPYQSELGGLETVVLNLAKGLQARGHTVSFLGSCKILNRLLGENDFKVTELAVPAAPVSKKSFFWFVALFPYLWWQFRKVVQDLRPGDALYMLSLGEKLIMTKMAHDRGIQVIWGEHEAVMEENGTFRTWLARNPFLGLYRRNSRYATVVTVSSSLQKQFQRLGGVKNLTVVANGVDTHFFTPSFTRTTPLLSGKFIIGTVGRLKEEKGLAEFLTVAYVLKDTIPNLHIVICGEGPLRPQLENLVRHKDMEAHVTFLGEIPHAHIREVYNLLDVALFLSKKWETFGLTPLESMAMRRPTILSPAFGFVDESMKPELLLADANDTDRIVTLVTQLFHQPTFAKTIAEKGSSLVERRFSLDSMVQGYEKILLSDTVQ